jgi:hypothetical protein
MVLANACGPCIGYEFPHPRTYVGAYCLPSTYYNDLVADTLVANGIGKMSRRALPTPSSRLTTVTSPAVTMPTPLPTPSSLRPI